MGEKRRSLDEIERAIAMTRQDLIATAHELEVVVRDQISWRQHFRRRPVVWLGAAFALGLLVGL